MKRQALLSIAAALLLGECAGAEPARNKAGGAGSGVIESVRIAGDFVKIPYPGDLWTATWDDDDRLFLAFGDATGMNGCLPTLLMDEPDEFDEAYVEESPGCYRPKEADNEYCEVFSCAQCLPLCQYTPAGLVELRGPAPNFETCDGPDQCVVSRHIPYGDLRVFEHSDKPSSLVFIGGRMYMHLHYPPGEPTYGYVAYSDNDGESWKAIPDSPWGQDSPFRVMMFINMGRAYGLNRDGYLYGLGIGEEIGEEPELQQVYLARVRVRNGGGPDPVLDYRAYEYFAGWKSGGEPRWVGYEQRDEAAPLEGLATAAQGSAIYHEGAGRYLFLSGLADIAPGEQLGLPGVQDPIPAGVLYEAPKPWGPWRRAGMFPGGYIPSIIPKDAGPRHFYFTASGGGFVTYNLNVGRMEFELGQGGSGGESAGNGPPFRLLTTRKLEQVIGDLDFETLKPTRQQTETRFGIAHTDLGAPFEHGGKLYFLFGDSDPEAPGWDERHDDAIAWTEAEGPEDFLLTFLKDSTRGRGYANPRISCPDEGKDDCVDLGTLNVPVAGLSDGETMFVWFAVDSAGRSLLARSEDGGYTFRKVYDFGRTHFIDIAAARVNGPLPGMSACSSDQWVLIFGSGNHDNPDVYLAAAPLESLRAGDRQAVRFLSGAQFPPGGEPQLTWSPKESDAVPLFRIEHGPGLSPERRAMHAWAFGEPLIHYSRELDLWLATYNAQQKTIRLRAARHPWGPWSDSMVLFDPAKDYGWGPAYGRYIGDGKTPQLGAEGELYGPYLIPRFTRILPGGSVRLNWLLSTWQPYTVVLMESVLERTQ